MNDGSVTYTAAEYHQLSEQLLAQQTLIHLLNRDFQIAQQDLTHEKTISASLDTRLGKIRQELNELQALFKPHNDAFGDNENDQPGIPVSRHPPLDSKTAATCLTLSRLENAKLIEENTALKKEIKERKAMIVQLNEAYTQAQKKIETLNSGIGDMRSTIMSLEMQLQTAASQRSAQVVNREQDIGHSIFSLNR